MCVRVCCIHRCEKCNAVAASGAPPTRRRRRPRARPGAGSPWTRSLRVHPPRAGRDGLFYMLCEIVVGAFLGIVHYKPVFASVCVCVCFVLCCVALCYVFRCCFLQGTYIPSLQNNYPSTQALAMLSI